jgi:predicted aspartyl protease
MQMRPTYVTLSIKPMGSKDGAYASEFLVDSGATNTLVPAFELRKAGIATVGRMSYELADGTVKEFDFGLAQIEFMGEITGRSCHLRT